MKYFTTLLALLLSYSMLGQFIPQPMGYNPDANGDSFIGVDDLTGMLSLYGTAFQSGDSLTTESWVFPEDNGPYTDIEIPEHIDVLYVHQQEDQQIKFFMPLGTGYKVLQVFLSCEGFYQWEVEFYNTPYNNGDYDGGTYMFDGSQQVRSKSPRLLTFIRGINGVWYSSR